MYVPCFQRLIAILSSVLGDDVAAIIRLALTRHLVVALNCGSTAILGVHASYRLRGSSLHIHPKVRISIIYQFGAATSCVIAVLALLSPAARALDLGEWTWALYSFLLLTGYILASLAVRGWNAAALAPTATLCFAASAEFTIRAVRWTNGPLAVIIPCLFWLGGLLQLALWSDRSFHPVLYESLATRTKVRWLAPLFFVMPVGVAVVVGTLGRWGYLARGYDEAASASLFCVGLAAFLALGTKLLLRTEQGFWELLEDGDEAILLIERTSHNIRSCNANAIKLWGNPVEQRGRPIEDLLPVIPFEQLCKLTKTLDGNSRRAGIEIRCISSDGTERCLALRVTIALFRGRTMIVLHAIDVSEYKRMRQEQSQNEKAHTVNQLASGIAHDFGNLLSGARMCSDLIAEGLPAGNDFQELFKQVDSSLESAEQLAHWLLSYSRPRKESQETTDLNRIVLSVSHLLRRTLGSSVSVQTRLCEDIEEVQLDPVQLQEVIINIALNARDSMPHGGTLSFETKSLELRSFDPTLPIPGALRSLVSD